MTVNTRRSHRYVMFTDAGARNAKNHRRFFSPLIIRLSKQENEQIKGIARTQIKTLVNTSNFR